MTRSSSVQVTVSNSNAIPSVYVDQPAAGATVSGTVLVSGWALHNTAVVANRVTGVKVLVDGAVVGTANYNLPRADVCAAGVFPGRLNCPNVGFSYLLNTRLLTPGTHTLTVNASETSTPPLVGGMNVPITVNNSSVAPVPDTCLDFPAAGQQVTGSIAVGGWALVNRAIMAPNGMVGSVQVLVDNVAVGTAAYGDNRADVCVVYPMRSGCPNVGFHYSLDTSGFLPGSTHTVSAVASDTSTPTPVAGIFTTTVRAATQAGVTFAVPIGFTSDTSIDDAQVVFNFGPVLNNGCAVHFVPSARMLYLADKSGLWSYSMPLGTQLGTGTLGDLTNANCQIVGNGSKYQLNGNNLVLTLQVTFAGTFIGPQNIYTQVSDQDGAGPYQLVGAWTAYGAPSAAPPTGVAPSSYDPVNHTLTVQISDANGFGYMPAAYLEFGPSQTDANTCRVLFQRGTGVANHTLTIYAGSFDAIALINAAQIGAPGKVQSAACEVDVGSSSVSESGNTATLILAVTFGNGAIGTGTVNSYVGPVDRAGTGATVPVGGGGTYGGFAAGSFFVQANDFALSSQNSSLAFQAGSSAGFGVQAAASGGFNLASLSYSCTATAGITCTSGTSGTNFAGAVSAAAALTGSVTVTASGGGTSHTFTIPVSVTAVPPPPTFSVVFPGISTIPVGQPAFLSLGFTALNLWTSPVTFSIVPGSVTTGFSACISYLTGCTSSLPVDAGSPVQIQMQRSLVPIINPNCASIQAIGTQTGNTVSMTGQICVNVSGGSIPATVQLTTLTSVVVPVGGSVTVTAGVNSQGSAGPVTLTSGNTGNVQINGGASAVFAGGTGTAQVTFSAGNRAPGSYNATLTATAAGGVTATTPVTVTIPSSTGTQSSTTVAGGVCPSNCGVYAIPNDGIEHPVDIYISGAPSTALASCSAVPSNSAPVAIGIRLINRAGNPDKIGITVPQGDPASTQQMTCYLPPYGSTTVNSSPRIQVYDATPVITSVTPNPVVPGPNTIVIRGHNFGTHPSVSIGGVAFDPGSVQLSGNQLLTVSFNISQAAVGTTLPIYVTSSGENGQSFQANQTSSSSNVFNLMVSAGIPVITSLSPIDDAQGGSGSLTIAGVNFGSNPQVTISGLMVGSVSSGPGNSLVINYTVPTNASVGQHDVSVQTQGGTASAPFTVVLTQMQLSLEGNIVINRANNYSEDATIRITAVRADNGGQVRTWSGTVTIGEDMTDPTYVQIYSQNIDRGASLPNSITIPPGSSANGSTTLTARSLAGPNGFGPTGGSPPRDAKLTTINYPLFGSSLSIPQWVVSGYPVGLIDARASGSVFDWVQSKAQDLFSTATGDLATVLDAVSSYTIGAIEAGGQTSPYHGIRNQIIINPYFLQMRVDADANTLCGNVRLKFFTNTFFHEARHAFQGFQATQSLDSDQDYLVKAGSISAAPFSILEDSAVVRNGCKDTTLPSVLIPLGFLGDGLADAYAGNVEYVLEEDALTFAVLHTPPAQ